MAQYTLDQRVLSSIQEEIRGLAASYVPQWKYRADSQDMGCVIANIYAEQMAENIQQYNALLARYEDKLAEMTMLCPECARPAEGVVVLQAAAEGIREADVKKGSRFFGQSGETETPIVFESVHDVHVTNAKITKILSVSEKKGEVKSYRELEQGKEQTYDNELVIFHPYLFAEEGRNIDLDLGDVNLYGVLCDGQEYEWLYRTPKGEQMTIPVKRLGKLRFQGISGARELIIRRKHPVRSPLFFPRIVFYTAQYRKKPAFLTNGNQELESERLTPFGEELSLYVQCYIGLQEELVHPGIKVCVEAELSYGEKHFYTVLSEEEELKLIKRAPMYMPEEKEAEVFVQETAISYYNGRGFRSLVCSMSGQVFSGEGGGGHIRIEFDCPDDMEPLELEGWKGYALRLQVIKADDCYRRPGVHYYPILHNLQITYSFGEESIYPESVIRKQGNRTTDLTECITARRPIPAFAKFPYKGETLLFGFERKPEGGPVSLYLILRENENYKERTLHFSYSSGEGFAPLPLTDSTKGLTVSGLWRFYPPEHMKMQEIEGKMAYWIRVETEEEFCMADIRKIYLNGVRVRNVERSPLKEYYLEETRAYMTFPVYGKQILKTNVWVNEVERLSPYQIRRMLKEKKEELRLEYDSRGNIAACYVLWREVTDFSDSSKEDRHYLLDRRKNQIQFGDGMYARRPSNLVDAAFRVETESCDGSMGNVKAMSVNKLGVPILEIEEVYNPLEISGGSDMEKEEQVKARSSILLGTAGRLVTLDDYIREAENYEEAIAQVRGRMKDGVFYLAALMKDYETGMDSFHRIQKPLKEHLIRQGTKDGIQIQVVEPVFVKVSIRLWASCDKLNEGLEEKAELLSWLPELFKSSVMGRIPEEGHLLMLIQARMKELQLLHYQITGTNEKRCTRELSELADEPFAFCISGRHEIEIV